MARPRPEVLLVERRGRKVIVQRVRNPIDIMSALNAAGDLVAVQQLAQEAEKKRGRRKNPYGEGRCPPHLKKFRFKKVR